MEWNIKKHNCCDTKASITTTFEATLLHKIIPCIVVMLVWILYTLFHLLVNLIIHI